MKPRFSESTWFGEGLAMIKVDGHPRFIDKMGGTALDLKDFCNAWGFAEGLAPVEFCGDRGALIID